MIENIMFIDCDLRSLVEGGFIDWFDLAQLYSPGDIFPIEFACYMVMPGDVYHLTI